MAALMLVLTVPVTTAAELDKATTRVRLPAALARTGRHCLVALGTQRDYLVPGARYDLVIVSPENPPGRALARARKDHPGAVVLGYLNTMDVFAVSARTDRELSRHEDWFLHDQAGERVRVRVAKYEGDRARFGMNVGVPGYQDWLADGAIAILKAGYDGLQLDNVETDSSYTQRQVGPFISALPVELDHARWPAAQRSMLARIRARLDQSGFSDRLIIFNQIRSGEPEESRLYLSEVDGANCEGWIVRDRPFDGRFGWKARVDQAASVSRSGRLLNLLALTPAMSAEEALYLYASYLLAREGDGLLFFYGTALRPAGTRWYDFYDLDLGEPRSASDERAGAHVREFARGFVAVNPYDTPAVLKPPEGTVDIAFAPVRQIDLAPRQGMILQRVGPEGLPRRIVLEAESGRLQGDGQVVDKPGASSGRAVRFDAQGTTLLLETEIPAGRWRVVVDGFAEGRRGDACFVEAGDRTVRVYFAPAHRPHFEMTSRGGRESIRIEAAEPGVAVDRVILVNLAKEGAQ